ncbi:MAG: response regulator transcription factor [Spirochaetaceae bacterium]|nr:response regulator transcription factor [Spirochaetaceae bacterium]
MGTERILIIEDDLEIQELLKHSFAREGWKLIHAISGEEGLAALKSGGADCIILDIMLPGQDGFKVLKKIRELEDYQTLPIIMCTALGEEADIVTGLELGADDYVVKPYSPRILAARIRSGLRRKEIAAIKNSEGIKKPPVLQHGALKLDVDRHSAFLGDVQIDLFATEFAILAHFMSNPDIVFTRQKLITTIRGEDYPVTDRSIDVQILGLRKKLKECGEMIETIRGVGYRFKPE